MKCPKCQYISFDHGDRCRNCGYEFSLTVEPPPFDLPIQTGDEALGPLGDFALGDAEVPVAPRRSTSGDYTPPNDGFPIRGPLPPPRVPTPVRVQSAAASSEPRRAATEPLELPLFNDRHFDDDRPLVTPPAVPRAPLSVRRSGPPLPRPQSRTPSDELRFDLESAEPRRPGRPVRDDAEGTNADAPSATGTAAPAGRRVLAALVDVLLLASIDLAVLYLTLQLLDFQVRELVLLPKAPLAGFLLLLNGGYCVTFTAAGGQTIGKMLTGIKVVPADESAPSDRVPLGHAALRTAAYLVSALPAGLGYLPALVSKDRRAVHDRLADTRVVQS